MCTGWYVGKWSKESQPVDNIDGIIQHEVYQQLKSNVFGQRPSPPSDEGKFRWLNIITLLISENISNPHPWVLVPGTGGTFGPEIELFLPRFLASAEPGGETEACKHRYGLSELSSTSPVSKVVILLRINIQLLVWALSQPQYRGQRQRLCWW